MIYSKEEQQSHIKELQNYIYHIGLHNPNIAKVMPDGIYGEKTAEAVRQIQHDYNLPQTGETDLATWETIILLYRHYEEQNAETINVFHSDKECSICKNNHGHHVEILHAMLKALSDEYSNLPDSGDHEEYDEFTVQTIKAVQKRSGIPETGETDKYTWNSIVRLFNSI